MKKEKIIKDLEEIILMQEKVIITNESENKIEVRINKYLSEKNMELTIENENWRKSKLKEELFLRTKEIAFKKLQDVYTEYDKIVPKKLKNKKIRLNLLVSNGGSTNV
jgi:hypothetical protein|tara:strand:+ start:1701 stop:2024 length:324 start_codon:yes stop_codon:yes gene_type:complete